MSDLTPKPVKAHVPGLNRVHVPGEPVRLSDDDVVELKALGRRDIAFRNRILMAAGVLDSNGHLTPAFAKK
ncbi:MAG TPA: hypothetical protein VLA61_26595 [Ideonella sp.]|uniref:hypothetical protein n=1 Tax=Ideonella sp. TaxID=1929293 RepID=UPI002C3DF912|nr:hypothetical protein [Ideonella sp.]HSI51852.1 hypothetical protein [Ideonella sp.]